MLDLKKLWEGGVTLQIAFWVWGVLVTNLLLGWALGLLVGATENQFLMLLHSIFATVASLFVAVAIWRSAGNYKGSVLWMFLARLVCVANVALLGLWALGVLETGD